MPEKNELGSAYFKVRADVTDAERELDGFKDKADEVTQSAEPSGKQIGATFEDMGGRVSDSNKKASKSFSEATERIQSDVSRQIGAITGLVGSFTAVVGVATLFFNIGKKIGEVLVSQTDQAKEYRKELDKLPDSYQAINRAANTLGIDRFKVLSEDNERVASSIAGMRIEAERMGLTLEELVDRSAQIRAKFSELATEQASIENRFGLEILSSQQLFDLRATQEEKRVVGLVDRLNRVAAEAIEEGARRAAEQSRAELEALQQAEYDNLIERINDGSARASRERDAALERIRTENRQLEDQLLGPLEAQERGLVEKLGQLNDRLASSSDTDIKDATRRQINLLEQVLANLRDSRKEQVEINKAVKEMPAQIERAVENGMDRVLNKTGLLAVQTTLANINNYADQILTQLDRR